ncbi:MAG: hypothetical protein ACYC7D_11165 [Nitrososphaerales archaeon]
MARKKVRDIYGNWVWESDEEQTTSKKENELDDSKMYDQTIKLDWRDYVALTIASLETFLLPLVIFIFVIIGIALILALLR